MSEWEYDMDMAALRELTDCLWLVEEIPVARIRELSNEHVIECQRFITLWEKLLDVSHEMTNVAEERMEAIPCE
jgi:hypothetical protein